MSSVGQMTRTLHDSLRGLGFDKWIEKVVHAIPNARDRLDCVAKIHGQADDLLEVSVFKNRIQLHLFMRPLA